MFIKYNLPVILFLFLQSSTCLFSQELRDKHFLDETGFYFISPSGIPFYKSQEFLFLYEVPFGLNELASKSISLFSPLSKKGFILHWENFGEKLYIENTFNVGLGLLMTEGFSIGLNGKYRRVDIEKYFSAGKTNFDLGGSLNLRKKILLDVLFENILPGSREYFPQGVCLGVKYFLSKNFILRSVVKHERDFPDEYCIDSIIILGEVLTFNFGGSINPHSYLGGFHYHINQFHIGYTIMEHNTLGFSHKFSFVYCLN